MTTEGERFDYFVDAHCHLVASEFDEDIDQVISNSQQNGLKAALVVAEHFSDFSKILKLAGRYPDFIGPCLGLHPVQKLAIEEHNSVTLQHLAEAASFLEEHHDKLFAIGEIGLDFTPRFIKTADDKEIQRQVFIKQIELAKRFDLPVNCHSRSAGRPTIAILKEHGVEHALLHAFDGRASVAMEGVQAGYYFSVPPSIVRSEQTQKLVKQLPIDSLILETDSPALGPEKQVRNEPSNIAISCDYIATVKGLSREEVMHVTTRNALKLFPKLAKILK